jgi:hypothetical protein
MDGEGVMMDVCTTVLVAGTFDLVLSATCSDERTRYVRGRCPDRRDWCLLARHLVH